MGRPPPRFDAEVRSGTSQASLSYLVQVKAREQSKEQWCQDHVPVIPQQRKVTETVYRNLDSVPVISNAHNNPLSLEEEEFTFILTLKKMCCHRKPILVNVYHYLAKCIYLLAVVPLIVFIVPR